MMPVAGEFDYRTDYTILRFMGRLLKCICLSGVVLLSACGLFGGDDGATDDSQILPTSVPDATAVPQGTPGVSAPALISESRQTLNVWIPPEISQRTGAGATALSEQLLAFASGRPEVATRVEPKPFGGPGGILSYLRTGHVVAPTIMPDLIALPVAQLASAASEGLIFPIGDLLEPSLLDDLFPAALAMARPGDETLAYPFAVTGLSHLAFHTTAITTSVPSTWDAFSTALNGQLILPASGNDGARFALEFYLASGGFLTNETGQPAIQVEPMIDVLETMRRGRAENFIAIQSSNVTTLDEAWQLFQTGAVAAAPTTSDQFLELRDPEMPPGYAQIPGSTGPLTPLVGAWAWAISSADPVQKRLAADLISALVAGPALGEWSERALILPSRRSALEVWDASDPYTNFLSQELERAIPLPAEANNDLIQALGDALFDVVSLASTPREAAEAAVLAIER
jgi:hypothetical protein